MKKIVFSLTALLALCGSMVAQDTLVSLYPKSNCYYNYWPSTGEHMTVNYLPQGFQGLWTAVYFYTEDSLPVYGIAAALWLDSTNALDFSPLNSYEYLGVYRPFGGEFYLIGDSLLAALDKSPIAYYFDYDLPLITGQRAAPRPVYEFFYNEPIVVKDSFYLGITQRTWACDTLFPGTDSAMLSGQTACPKVRVTSYAVYHQESDARIVYRWRDYNDSTYYIYQDNNHYGLPQYWNPYFFPILAPPDTTLSNPTDTTIVDTTIVDTTTVDTTGISVQLLERYIGVQPNPAAERVLVTSSFGLQSITLFNAAGIKVQEQKATGYSATLDIRSLPEGTYLVRIATPSGTVTKKLLVQRR